MEFFLFVIRKKAMKNTGPCCYKINHVTMLHVINGVNKFPI